MEALPDELMTEIFSYLPAKSVGRFHSLSRSWRAALSSTSFVHLHLRRANKPGELKVFFSPPDDDTSEEGPYNDDESNDEGTPEEDDGDASEQEPNGDDDNNPEEEDGDASEQEPNGDDDNTPEEEEEHDDVTTQEPEEEESDDGGGDTWEEESYFYAWQPGGAPRKLTPNNFHTPIPLTRPLHGLVLIRCTVTGYHVCNPCTGASLALPDSSQLTEKKIWRPYRRDAVLPLYQDVAYGLGYCSVTGEYKAVRLFSTFADADECSPNLCEVLVLGTLAYWRPIAQKPPACIVQEDNPGVFLNGCLHFLCDDGGIVAFDVSGETFGSVSPPPNPEYARIKMTELDGCLCICHGSKDYGTYHVWVLRNYKQGKWEQLCRVDPTAWTEPERMQLDSLWIAPLGMYNRDDNGHKKIMFDTGTCKVFAVDVPNGNTPELIFNPEETIGSSYEDYGDPVLGLFEESLVPVGRTIEEMVLSSPHAKAWFDILKWMPTQSVADLSLVCRAWRAMVKDDHFIRSHVAHANLNKSPRIMMIRDPTFGEYMDLQDIIDLGESTQESTYLVCSQPCHGLNAGTIHSRSFICNPVKGYLENIDLDGVDDDTFFAGQTGLGYDSKNNVHVLVLITYREKNLATREYKLECKLRYVHEHERRSVDPPPRPVADVPPTYVNGKIFWLVEPNLGPVSPNCEIVAFDIENKEFEVLQGPPCSNHDNVGRMSILQLQGALCVSCSDKSSNAIDIWKMKDIGIWSIECHIELEEFSPEYSSERTTPMAVDPTDGRILLSTGQSLGYYDPETAAMETLYSIAAQWPDVKFCPVICHESFVSTLCDESFIRAL